MPQNDCISVTPKEVLDSAWDLKADIIADRREIHKHPETGICLPNTVAYVKKRLTEMGYAPTEICESGIVAAITGRDTGKCILLRADMDGLKVQEETAVEFKSENGMMHACGHDMHTAMLLGAAAILKKYQDRLEGTVKLVFQPDEEGFTGTKSMLNAGVLENPEPQAGLALHVHSGSPSGLVLYGKGTAMAGCTLFRIRVTGVSCHGAMPETGVDPINIAAHIYLAIQEIISREIGAKKPVVVTIGRFEGGQAPNIIPQETVMEGTIRTFDRDLSAWIFARIETVSQNIAAAFRGKAVIEEIASAPPLINDTKMTEQAVECCKELFGKNSVYCIEENGMGSEDFASYTYEIPCAYLLLGAGSAEENILFGKPMHNEKVVFNEEILPKGAAIHAYCAMKWLMNAIR